MDRGLNDLLKWSIENSTPSNDQDSTGEPQPAQASDRPLSTEALKALMGGPSDAELMKESMAAIVSPDITIENKLIAFDNFEQLIENLDNANNMENLELWSPLVSILKSEEAELRKYAAWCLGTAVQNNVKAQQRLLLFDAIPKLIELATKDKHEQVRRKAIYALSSEIRNYQPALDAAVEALPKNIAPEGGINATDMDAVDRIIDQLKEKSAHAAAQS